MGKQGRQICFRKTDGAQVAAARRVAATLTRAGFQTLFAGGCVRDALLDRPIKDIDLATAATPDQVEACFPGKTVAVGKAFGVVLVRCNGFSFDVATFRRDGGYRDGRHPEAVCYVTAEADAQRRDFTVNGLFCDPVSGAVMDAVGGLADLDARVVRAIGDPVARFREDHLRLLRAVRFAATLSFRIEAQTHAALQSLSSLIRSVSAERIARELERLLCESPLPSRGLALLRESGLLDVLLPEVAALYGTAQPPQYHPEGDVWTHTGLMLDALPPPRDPILTWAILLHDIGKPVTYREEPDASGAAVRIRFPCHAPVGAGMAERLLQRLRRSSACLADVKWLVLNHMRFVEAGKMRPAKLRRLMGDPRFKRLLELMRLDTLHSTGDFATWSFLRTTFDAYTSEPVLPPPLVCGRDLLAWGVPSGPGLGNMLATLYDAQLEGRIASWEEARRDVTRRLREQQT